MERMSILLLSYSLPIKTGLEKYAFNIRRVFEENGIKVFHAIRGLRGFGMNINLKIDKYKNYLKQNDIHYVQSLDELMNLAKQYDKILMYNNVGLTPKLGEELNYFVDKFCDKIFFWVGAPDEFSIRSKEIKRGWGFVKEEIYSRIRKIFIQRPLPEKFFQRYPFLKKEYFVIAPIPFDTSDVNSNLNKKKDKISLGMRICFKKGILNAIDIAMESNTSLELWGEEVNSLIFLLRREAFQSGIVKYLGDFNDYKKIYEQAKFSFGLTSMRYCLPGLEYQQLEAISCGSVVIGRDDLIPIEAGISISSENIVEKASKIILDLKFDEEKRVKIAEKALNFVIQNHSYKNVIKYYKGVMI